MYGIHSNRFSLCLSFNSGISVEQSFVQFYDLELIHSVNWHQLDYTFRARYALVILNKKIVK